ncbi:ABC transporter substrate-binding protein [Shewanella surugensis]|uniref:ABC transporter substrate-binding protein n=1 Tax=Shewanella surugensis TaxID=212020 RepID=A0ABT0LBR1_9GAMM|nr:ABC transporter substrate-binding protein [Shewanella surugensis]MCL1125122.1 ABC transporter substrate-binding protein [Shewanella surugensis]
MKSIILISGLLLSTATHPVFAEEQCGKVTIADMNWSSASLIANVDRFILEKGYGCDAELIPGDTMPTTISMVEKSEPDIAPEIWRNNVKELIERGLKDNRLAIAGKSLSDGGEEGFWVPQYMVDKDPSLKTIKGVIANVKLFKNPENPDRGAFYGCPAGWGCQIASENLFRALKLSDAGFNLIDPGSGAGLAGSIARAYTRKKPWFGYYWAPTAILGKYKMSKVEFGSGTNIEEYQNCIAKPDCVDPKVTMFPTALVQTVTIKSFAEKSPLEFEYLAKRSFTNAQMNSLLAWMEDNQADGKTAAEYFLMDHEDIWINWLPTDVAKKVKSAVNAL